MFRILNSLPLLYLAMLWPGRYAVWGLIDRTWYYPQMMYDSGLVSIWLLIITFAVTPTLMIINRTGFGKPVGRWLLQRRRHFGLGSFIFATVHLIHYILETASLRFMYVEFFSIEFTVGWLAFVIFTLLAFTSNNWSTRKLGRKWKSLHNWAYPAAALSFLHWHLFDFFTDRVLFWLAILLAIKCVHAVLHLLPRHVAIKPDQERHQPSA